jgi:hypothetical protein
MPATHRGLCPENCGTMTVDVPAKAGQPGVELRSEAMSDAEPATVLVADDNRVRMRLSDNFRVNAGQRGLLTLEARAGRPTWPRLGLAEDLPGRTVPGRGCRASTRHDRGAGRAAYRRGGAVRYRRLRLAPQVCREQLSRPPGRSGSHLVRRSHHRAMICMVRRTAERPTVTWVPSCSPGSRARAGWWSCRYLYAPAARRAGPGCCAGPPHGMVG